MVNIMMGPEGSGKTKLLIGALNQAVQRESGSIVCRTGKTAGIPVGDGFLGRVVDALGMPIDGQGDIPSEGYLPIESPAPGIIDRQPVNAPMETCLLYTSDAADD